MYNTKLYSLLGIIWLVSLALVSCKSQECEKRNNLTRAEIDAVPSTTPAEDVATNIKCYSKCMFEEYFDANGKVDPELVGNRASQRELNVLSNCKKLYDHLEIDPCEYSYRLFQCLDLQKAV